jgi:HEPN domain-containing protein
VPPRYADWLRQAQPDLAHAQRAAEDEDYEWSYFAAQQGAEKALKAVYQRLGAVAWGHSVTNLLTNLITSPTSTNAMSCGAPATCKGWP